MFRFVGPYDEGLILTGSARVLSGEVPYRDFFENYAPAQFYVLAALFKLLGPSVLVERLWDLMVRASTVLVIYLIVDGAWSRGKAVSTAALSCVWLSYFGFYGFPVFPCLLFSLLSLYCLLPIYQGSHAIARLLASGICAGITVLFRHDVGIACAVGGIFTLGLFHLTKRPRDPNKIRTPLLGVTIYTAGVGLALMPPLVLLYAAGSAHDILVDLVLIPARTYVRMVSLPFPSVVAIARETMQLKLQSLEQLAVYLPVGAVPLGIMGALKFGKNYRYETHVDHRALTSQRLWTLVQLTILSLLFFFKGWVRVSPIHMALSIVPSIVIMIVWQIEAGSGAAKILFRLGIAWLSFISLTPMQNVLIRFGENLVWAAGGRTLSNGVFGSARSENGSCFPPAGLERIRCLVISSDQPAAIRYIQEHTAENEGIFVGLNRHDKIFINNVLFYFVSKRPPVTKWHLFIPGLQTTLEIQSEIINELQMRRPRYVVLTSKWDSVKEPNESAHSSGVTVLDQYIRTNYRAVAEFGPISILEIRW